MRLFKFSEFILESRSDSMLPTVFSKEFLTKIKDIDSIISGKLSDFHNDRNMSIFSFISIGDSDDTIKFTDSQKMMEYLKSPSWNIQDPLNFLKEVNPVFLEENVASGKFWSYNRNEMKIGRFIRRILPSVSDSDIEKFVNQWKSIDDTIKFEMWDSSQIKNAYSTKNYSDLDSSDNPLWNSCMNDEFDLIYFYSKCDVRVLLLLDNNNKILGRALVWNDTEGRLVMDRVYYIFDKDYYKFIKYAKDNGIYYKSLNISGFVDEYIKDGKRVKLKSEIKIPDVEHYIKKQYGLFPYMDTYLYAFDDKAMNYRPMGPHYKLVSTEGYYDFSEKITNKY